MADRRSVAPLELARRAPRRFATLSALPFLRLRETFRGRRGPLAFLAVVEVASRVATTIARESGWLAANDELLYGRYDVVRLDDGSPALLEAELFEPCFFLPTDSEAPRRFVDAVIRRLPNS